MFEPDFVDPSLRRKVLEESAGRILEVGRRHREATTDRYPDWTVGELMIHVSRVHRFVTPVVRDVMDRPPETRDDPPADDQIETFFEDGVAALLKAFDTADIEQPCWGYGPGPTVGRWLRRMALETEVHRWDADSSRDVFDPLDPQLAADGIDELRIMWLPWLKGGPLKARRPGPLVVLEASDVGASWTISINDGLFEVFPGRDPSCASQISGPASDMYLYMLGRRHGHLHHDLGDDHKSIVDWLIDHMAEAKI